MCKQFHSRRLERWSKRTVGEECLVLGEYVSARVRGLMPDVEGVLSVHLDVSLMKKTLAGAAPSCRRCLQRGQGRDWCRLGIKDGVMK